MAEHAEKGSAGRSLMEKRTEKLRNDSLSSSDSKDERSGLSAATALVKAKTEVLLEDENVNSKDGAGKEDEVESLEKLSVTVGKETEKLRNQLQKLRNQLRNSINELSGFLHDLLLFNKVCWFTIGVNFTSLFIPYGTCQTVAQIVVILLTIFITIHGAKLIKNLSKAVKREDIRDQEKSV